MNHLSCSLYIVGIIIGFDPSTYAVNEEAGSVTLVVRVLDGTLSEGQSVPVRVITADGTAQGNINYNHHGISSNTPVNRHFT